MHCIVVSISLSDALLCGGEQGGRKLGHAGEMMDLSACKDFAVFAGSAATCAGAPDCHVIGGFLGISPGTSYTGNFVLEFGDQLPGSNAFSLQQCLGAPCCSRMRCRWTACLELGKGNGCCFSIHAA
jgi:hypothetical protein